MKSLNAQLGIMAEVSKQLYFDFDEYIHKFAGKNKK